MTKPIVVISQPVHTANYVMPVVVVLNAGGHVSGVRARYVVNGILNMVHIRVGIM